MLEFCEFGSLMQIDDLSKMYKPGPFFTQFSLVLSMIEDGEQSTADAIPLRLIENIMQQLLEVGSHFLTETAIQLFYRIHKQFIIC